MNRRGFLQVILATGMAPAIVRADSLMRIVPREMLVIGVDPAGEDSWTGYLYFLRGLDQHGREVVRRVVGYDGNKLLLDRPWHD